MSRLTPEHVAAQLAAVDLTEIARAARDREAEERIYQALACGHYRELLDELRAHRERAALRVES